MTDEPVGDSGFTHREMRVIFERAGQLEAASDSERRFTLAELQEMGAEAGLAAGDVAKAAASVRTVTATHRLLGAPTRFHSSLELQAQLSEAEVTEVIVRIREATGLHGDVRVVPGGTEWRARSPLGAVVVDIVSHRRGNRVNLLVARDDSAALTVITAGAVGLVVGVVASLAVALQLHGAEGIALAAGAVVAAGTAWGTARALWGREAARARAKGEAVMRSIAAEVERLSNDPTE